MLILIKDIFKTTVRCLKMYSKCLVLCIGFCLLLGLSPINAQEKARFEVTETTMQKLPVQQMKVGPDLTVESVGVTSPPFVAGSFVLVPLEITIGNSGPGNVVDDFNVGAIGWATDGNVMGSEFGASGEEQMEAGGVRVSGLAAGASKTYNGILLLKPQPLTSNNLFPPIEPGSNYIIRAMVDYSLDPDGTDVIDENDENNNDKEIEYPLVMKYMASASKLIPS
jgi:hypothetical protein